MNGENAEWAVLSCPESNGDPHEPRAVRLLPEVTPMQTEVELEVVCRRCGARGNAALVLTYASVIQATGETR